MTDIDNTQPAADASPLDVVAAYFIALAEGRIDDALACFDTDVRWHQPGANRFSGTHHGPEAVAVLLGGMATVSEGTFAVAPVGPLMANGELVAAPVRFTGRRSAGATLDQGGIDLLTVREGRIVEVSLFSADPVEEDAFWGAASE